MNDNGTIDGGDSVVGTQQLAAGATAFNISTPLAQDAVNNFLVTATDAVGNQSTLTDVPTITEDSTAPTGLIVTSPNAPTTADATTFDVTGTAEAGSLVQIYRDVDDNGEIDAGDAVVGMQQLAAGATSFSIAVPLTQEVANNFVVTATDAIGNQSAAADVPTITEATPAVSPPANPEASTAASRQFIVVGTDAGAPALVRVYDAVSRAVVRDIVPFGGFAGGVQVALGDVNGDGRDDVIVGTATGATHVKVYDAITGQELRSFLPFGAFGGGVTLAAGDLDGDGRADIVVGTATGVAHVKAFSGATGQELLSFIAYEGFGGGVRVAVGDVNGDGRADVVTVAGPGGNGHIKAFDGRSLALLQSYLGYVNYSGEINIAVADVTGDGRGEVITAALNLTRGTHVRAVTADGAQAANFFAPAVASAAAAVDLNQRREVGFAAAPSPTGPARVAAADVNGDRIADYLLGSAPGAGTSRLDLVNGANGQVLSSEVLDALFGLGVFVGVN